MAPALLAAAAVLATTPAGAGAHSRWPVIGCDDSHDSFVNHHAWKYKLTGMCETSGALGELGGIDHAHAKHCGERRAPATGIVVEPFNVPVPCTPQE